MVNDDVVDYIVEEQLRGTSLHAIENALLEQGWSEGEVDDAIEYVEREVDRRRSDSTGNGDTVVQLTAALVGLVSVVTTALGISVFVSQVTRSVPPPEVWNIVGACVVVIFGLIGVALMYGLWSRQRWVRKPTLSYLYLLSIPLVSLPLTAPLLYRLHKHPEWFT